MPSEARRQALGRGAEGRCARFGARILGSITGEYFSLRLPVTAERIVYPRDIFGDSGRGGVEFGRVALRFGRRTPQTFNVGPYTFSAREMVDPSDYLDFTDEEYRKMQNSPDAMKLERQAKLKPIIGHGGEDDEGPWAYMGGYWTDRHARGAGAERPRAPARCCMHSQEISSDMEMSFQVRLSDAASVAEVELYAGADPGLRVQLSPPGKHESPRRSRPGVAMSAQCQSRRSVARNHAACRWLKTRRETGSRAASAKRRSGAGDGDRIYLKIAKGAADFDDVEFVVQRNTTDKSVLYAFNQPEPDWWREPAEKWIDHGGIACVMASSWVSLVAPDSHATMWNKRTFTNDTLVAFNVEENTEWRGWDKHPSHIHWPYENIEATLANEKDPTVCYTLTVNAEGHSATVLFRNGKEVARVRQDPLVSAALHRLAHAVSAARQPHLSDQARRSAARNRQRKRGAHVHRSAARWMSRKWESANA